MGGSPSKPASQRARRNKVSTNSILRAPEPGEVDRPSLPEGPEWHPMTVSWWRDIWSSPMAPEFDSSDIHGLYALAILVNQFWLADRLAAQIAASVEIRLQSQRYGLSPMDRRRLQWEIERSEEAKDRGSRRRRKEVAAQAPPPVRSGTDPRAILRSVS